MNLYIVIILTTFFVYAFVALETISALSSSIGLVNDVVLDRVRRNNYEVHTVRRI